MRAPLLSDIVADLRAVADEMAGKDDARFVMHHERPRYGCRCRWCSERRGRARRLRWLAGQIETGRIGASQQDDEYHRPMVSLKDVAARVLTTPDPAAARGAEG